MEEVSEQVELETTEVYVRQAENRSVGLESPDAYIRRVKAAIRWSKARAANCVAMILVIGLVASLPFYVLTVALLNADLAPEIGDVFNRWYDVVAPLLGAVIGALFGMSIASRERDESD